MKIDGFELKASEEASYFSGVNLTEKRKHVRTSAGLKNISAGTW